MRDIREVLLDIYSESAAVSKEKIRLLTEKINSPDRSLDQEINRFSGEIIAYRKVITMLQEYINEENAMENKN